MKPTWGQNRIFDAEALRNPLGGLLARSWTLLELKKVILESLLAALGALLGALGSEPLVLHWFGCLEAAKPLVVHWFGSLEAARPMVV